MIMLWKRNVIFRKMNISETLDNLPGLRFALADLKLRTGKGIFQEIH